MGEGDLKRWEERWRGRGGEKAAAAGAGQPAAHRPTSPNSSEVFFPPLPALHNSGRIPSPDTQSDTREGVAPRLKCGCLSLDTACGQRHDRSQEWYEDDIRRGEALEITGHQRLLSERDGVLMEYLP